MSVGCELYQAKVVLMAEGEDVHLDSVRVDEFEAVGQILPLVPGGGKYDHVGTGVVLGSLVQK